MNLSIIITSGILFVNTLVSFSQPIPVEVIYSNKDYRYQQFFFKELKASSHFCFFHTSSLYSFHDKERTTEMMSQSYVTYKLGKSLTALVGSFYASIPGFKASMSLQYRLAHRDLVVLLAPRIDLQENPSYELLTLAEYRPAISKRLKIYSRLQMLSNYTHTIHNRSYQNLRVGVGSRKTQGGFALNYDQYGSEKNTVLSMGIFLRHELNN